MKKNMIIGATVGVTFVAAGVATVVSNKETMEYIKLRKTNQELLNTIHWSSELTSIDREFGKRVANAGTDLSALEKEKIRHEVILDHVNSASWKSDIEA